jgi:tetratricopeptide (TPR) repeat protein
LGKYEEAIACYDEALKLNPNDANAYRNRQIALDKMES